MLFDLASLTKPLVTTPLALTYLDLDRDLSHLPPLSGFRKLTWPLTARQLLSHTAGLPPWLPYNGVPLAQQLSAPLPWNQHPLLVKPVAERGQFPACYSDLGYRLLAEAVEAVSGESWAKLGQQMTGLVPAPWIEEAPIALPPGPDRDYGSRERLSNLPSPLAGEGSGERETVMTFIIGGILQSHDRLIVSADEFGIGLREFAQVPGPCNQVSVAGRTHQASICGKQRHQTGQQIRQAIYQQGVEDTGQVRPGVHETLRPQGTKALPEERTAQRIAVFLSESTKYQNLSPATIPVRRAGGIDLSRGIGTATFPGSRQSVFATTAQRFATQPLIFSQAKDGRSYRALIDPQRFEQMNQATQPDSPATWQHDIAKERDNQGTGMHSLLLPEVVDPCMHCDIHQDAIPVASSITFAQGRSEPNDRHPLVHEKAICPSGRKSGTASIRRPFSRTRFCDFSSICSRVSARLLSSARCHLADKIVKKGVMIRLLTLIGLFCSIFGCE
jgi:hypothetical protein